MILQSLYQYYERLASENGGKIPEFGFSMENVGFVLEIDREGNLLQVHDIREREGKKVRPVLLEIPYTNAVNVRSVNIEANFLVDKAAYVLGADQKTKASRLPECYASFKNLLETVLSNTEDEGAQALLKFYEKWNPSQAPQKLQFWEDIGSDKAGFITWKLESARQYLNLRPRIKQAWQAYLKSQETTATGQCLISGIAHSKLQQLHAQFKGIAGGQSSGMSLVSFNSKSSESYNKEQSINAPVSIDAEFKSSTALKYLIRTENQHIYLSETYTVFWTQRDSPVEGMFGMIIDPKDTDVQDNANLKRFLVAVKQGKRPDNIDPDIKFYILGLLPNAARLATRFWHVCSVGQLEDRIGQHFRDLQIIKSRDSDPEFPGIRSILRETVNKKSQKAKASPLLAGTLMRCILEGAAYPQALQHAIINRIRADHDINYIRSAVLKAILVRKHRIFNQGMEVKMVLDQTNKNPAYLLGRLFAVLERVQYDAQGSLNATIKDRFWGAASATPNIVFPQLLNLKNHHISKIDNKGQAVNREKLIGEIIDELDAFPAHLNLDEQGMFAIGYYHQRQDLFKKNEPDNDINRTDVNDNEL